MNTKFEKLVKIIHKLEGGYVNDPDDKGGQTIIGITRKNHPTLAVWTSLDSLSTVKEKKAYKPTDNELNEINEVYRKHYYDKLKCDHFNNELLSAHLFAFGVNAGVSRAAQKLQKVLGIKQDGIVGSQTISTANIKTNVTNAYIMEIQNYYTSIAKGSQTKFLKGWMARISTVTQEVRK